MMQQQIPQQEQYVNQQQIQQPIMLCPIQYVYETPMLVPQPQEQQIQQNQTVVFNVQNPPPWIQNRTQTQNQVVYVQQVPNNYQPYIHPHMMQSTLYHPQLNYQIQQPMMTQDNRQFVQIPNLAPFNTVQSQITQPVQQQIKSEETGEKMPLLTQMLSQKAITNNVRPVSNLSNVNNATGAIVNNVATNMNLIGANNINNVRPANVNNLNAPGIIRPVTQNQQVQTDISANNKGRPKNAQPQVITINPMQQHQYVPVNQKPDVIINISRPTAPYMRADVPQHIRSKIPSSISVKSVYKPILPRPMRPFDVMQTPQNFYYNPNFVNVGNPAMRHSVMNTDNLQQNVNSQEEINQKLAEVNNLPAPNKMSTPNNMPHVDKTIPKQTADASVTANRKFDLVKIYNDNNDKILHEKNTEKPTENVPLTGEKLIRNTVFTQARGLILNDKQIVQSQSTKRTIHDRLEEERVATSISENPVRNSNKHIKIEVIASTSTLQSIPVNSLAPSIEANCDIQSNSNNLPMNSVSVDKTEHLTTTDSSKISENIEVPKPMQNVNTDSKEVKKIDKDYISTDKTEIDIAIQNSTDNTDKSRNNNSTLKTENIFMNLKRKVDEVKVLTHVLDGYIIQESNVAFPIQKPTKEKDNVRENKVHEAVSEQNKSTKADPQTNNASSDVLPQVPCIHLNKNIESEREMEFAVNKDDPFARIQKSLVQSWTTEELTAHLAKYEWSETAAKLGEEEIDGESLLLVNKEQLLAIGVCEQHADAIAAFTSTS